MITNKMNVYENSLMALRCSPKKWLVTGVAGFIGSNLLETLLINDQEVVGLDNLSTGYRENLDEVKSIIGGRWSKFRFIKGDIRNLDTCREACKDIDYVLHQAALGSVPRSINDPICTNSNNIDGFLNMLVSARDANVESFVYAASSSTYGDSHHLPKIERRIGKPLSPYAVTKLVNELYAEVFARSYNFKSIGLRYFNVFGPRQDPHGAYAAVIPRWMAAMLKNEEVYINGDGESSRDFCYVANIVQANILAATTKNSSAKNQSYNIAVGDRTSLSQLFLQLCEHLQEFGITVDTQPIYRDFRPGDVQHSQADITKAKNLLGYFPEYSISDGIKNLIPWFLDKMNTKA